MILFAFVHNNSKKVSKSANCGTRYRLAWIESQAFFVILMQNFKNLSDKNL